MTSHLETAAVLGVVLDEPYGEIAIDGHGLRIGSVVDQGDGTVLAVPRHGIGPAYTAQLLSVAEGVAITGRKPSAAWKFHPQLGWVAGVSVRLHRRTEITAAGENEEVTR